MLIGILRSAKREAEKVIEHWKLHNYYTAVHDHLDVGTHLREAIDWLKRAQDAGNDRGVSYGAKFGEGFLPSYPETTGYIIPTFLSLADRYRDDQYIRRAVEMGDWEISIQMDCGAVMGGRVDALPPTPAVFNTGMVLLGWAALYGRTGERRFLEAGRRAAEWLVERQEPDGSWRIGNSVFARADATVYNAKAAWGLCRFGTVCGNDRYVQAAVRNAEYALSHQTANGWFANCCLNDPSKPLLHTVAYTVQGIMEIGLLTGRERLVAAACRTADALMKVCAPDGFLAGRFLPDFSGASPWCCLTGSAQTSIIWSRLYEITHDGCYRDAAARVNRYLMARHDVVSDSPFIRGGLAGSWPVSGEYGRLMVLNWATKFLVDALLFEQVEGVACGNG